MPHRLHPHPAAPALPAAITAAAERRGRRLTLRFRLDGALDALSIAPPAAAERADDLWRDTCFEAFLAAPERGAYLELNLSPSTRWAAYRFDAYRSGMRQADIAPPRIEVRREEDALALDAEVDLGPLAFLPAARPWRAALTAVVASRDGRAAHLALAHAPGAPDFHHTDGFILTLPASESP